VRWKFVDLGSGWDIQVLRTQSERDQFMRYCNRERIRCGLLRVEPDRIEVEHPVLEVRR